MTQVNFERIEKLPMFQGLRPEELIELFRIATQLHCTAGQRLIVAGSKADCFYLILKGHLSIFLSQDPAALPIAQLGSGQLVGEMALLYAQPIRQADAVANDDAMLLRFGYAEFEDLAKAFPELGKKFRTNLGKIVASRIWSTLPSEEKSTKHQQAPVIVGTAVSVMKKATVFANLTPDEFQALASIAIPLNVSEGQPIVSYGDPADSFFLVTSGCCEVQISREGVAVPIARLGVGQVFGEMGVVYKQAERTADVIAAEDARLLSFPFDDYARLLEGWPTIGRKLRQNLGRIASGRTWTQTADHGAALKKQSAASDF